MAVKFDYLDKVGTDVKCPIAKWVRLPKSTMDPERTSATVEPTIYLNIKYDPLPDAKGRPGRAWVRVMRTDPADSTCNYFLWLPDGWSTMLDSRVPAHKWWAEGDAGRTLHVEVMIEGVKSAYLNDSCYTAFDQKW